MKQSAKSLLNLKLSSLPPEFSEKPYRLKFTLTLVTVFHSFLLNIHTVPHIYS